jgi:hypothetical protein
MWRWGNKGKKSVLIGRDTTGNGYPNLVISQGLYIEPHCCLSLLVFEISEKFHKLQKLMYEITLTHVLRT